MERCQCKSQHRKLMRENCGVRAAHIARDGARPQPLTLAFWPLPVPLTGLHMLEWNMGVVERLPNGSWNWYGMGIQWCSWWILWDFDLCSQLETTCDRPSCGTPQAQCDRESPAAASLTLCSPLRSPCLLRSFSGAVSNTTSPSSRSTQPCATPQPLSSARRHVRTRLFCAFEPCCAFNQ